MWMVNQLMDGAKGRQKSCSFQQAMHSLSLNVFQTKSTAEAVGPSRSQSAEWCSIKAGNVCLPAHHCRHYKSSLTTAVVSPNGAPEACLYFQSTLKPTEKELNYWRGHMTPTQEQMSSLPSFRNAAFLPSQFDLSAKEKIIWTEKGIW